MISLPQTALPQPSSSQVAPVPSETAAPRNANETAELRMVSDFFQLWRLCENRRCRRARACRAQPRDCLPRFSPIVPERARLWLVDLLAARATTLSFDEVLTELANFPDDCEALSAWFKAVGKGK
jgi:hypothetical protein